MMTRDSHSWHVWGGCQCSHECGAWQVGLASLDGPTPVNAWGALSDSEGHF